MTSLVLIPPVPVTDTILVSSNVAETDYAAWVAGTNYTLGTRVIRTATGVHKVFENLIPGVDATLPELAPTRWIAVSPTNRWKMFDTSNTTATVAASPISVVLLPGQAVNSVALLGLISTSVRVRMTDPVAGTVYDRTFTTGGVIFTADWYSYFFSLTTPVDTLTVLDLPPYPNCTVLIDVYNAAGSVQCATMVMGYQVTIGFGIQYGATVGITDYSIKTANAYGDYVLTPRPYSNRATFDMMLNAVQVVEIRNLLARYRAVPCVWIGPVTIFGFYKDFSITIPYPTEAQCSIEIEGMT